MTFYDEQLGFHEPLSVVHHGNLSPDMLHNSHKYHAAGLAASGLVLQGKSLTLLPKINKWIL